VQAAIRSCHARITSPRTSLTAGIGPGNCSYIRKTCDSHLSARGASYESPKRGKFNTRRNSVSGLCYQWVLDCFVGLRGTTQAANMTPRRAPIRELAREPISCWDTLHKLPALLIAISRCKIASRLLMSRRTLYSLTESLTCRRFRCARLQYSD
jgi:hypothetical protein